MLLDQEVARRRENSRKLASSTHIALKVSDEINHLNSFLIFEFGQVFLGIGELYH